ncbi:hypothetical protein ES703_65489 [subsurface metagenome]
MDAFDEQVDESVGGGANNGRVNDHVLEVHLAGLGQQLAGGGALDVEDAHGAPLPHEGGGSGVPYGLDVVIGQVVLRLAVEIDVAQTIPHHRQGAVAQKVDLHQPGVFHLVLLPLDDGHPLGGGEHRYVLANLIRHHDNTAGMHRRVVKYPHQPHG